jgi:hypothetical protein
MIIIIQTAAQSLAALKTRNMEIETNAMQIKERRIKIRHFVENIP